MFALKESLFVLVVCPVTIPEGLILLLKITALIASAEVKLLGLIVAAP